jgi:hypothetical protein
MSVPDIVRNITKSVRDKLSDRDELKEKAKDFPLYVLQQALSGVGQALLLGDRIRTRLKGQGGEETEQDAKAEGRLAGPSEDVEPARREPVIFAPRPAPDDADTTTDSNGAKPVVVVVPPAAPSPEAPVEPESVETKPVKPRSVKAKPARAKPVEPEVVEPKVVEPEPAEIAEVVEPAEAKADAITPDAVTSEDTTPEDTTADAPTADATAAPVAVPSTEAAGVAAGEPMPGYAELTVASLRARMRGKSAEQIRELLSYEKATSDRETVVKMYETRLAKLEAGE